MMKVFSFMRKEHAFKVLMSLVFVVSTFASCSGQTGVMKLASPPDGNAAVAPISAAAQNSYADTVSRVSPAVVTIRSTERTRAARQFPFMDDPSFREFFGDRLPQQPQQRVQGVGSGVIVNSQGYILTNHHVVDGAVEIKVELTDNRTFTAKLVGSDPPSDLAVLKIDATNLPTATLGDSDKVRVGDVVLAIGNPLGIGQTVTSGIISAKGRATGLSDGIRCHGDKYCGHIDHGRGCDRHLGFWRRWLTDRSGSIGLDTCPAGRWCAALHWPWASAGRRKV